MKLQNTIMTLMLTSSLCACTTLQSVSLTQIPSKRSNRVYAEADKLIFLGLNFDNRHVDQVKNQLVSKCRKGLLTGLLTKTENHFYLGALIYKSKVTASGFCLKK